MKKEKENKRYYRKEESLPKKLITKLKDDFLNKTCYEYRTKNKFLKCVALIYHHQVSNYHSRFNYVALGSAYWRKVLGHEYHKTVIKPLLSQGIIESHDFGFRNNKAGNNKTGKGKVKGLVGIRYRINPDLTDDDCSEISYINPHKTISAEEHIFNHGQEFIWAGLQDKIFHISINSDKAIFWLKCNAENICNNYLQTQVINSMPGNLWIECREFIEGGSYNTYFTTIASAKLSAEFKKKELFYYKDEYYIADISAFLNHRVPGLIYDYSREIKKVGRIPIEDKRSAVTLRLHNHLVNFPSKVLQFIRINNKPVVQLDLRTSQFLLFANILNIYLKSGENTLISLFKHKQNQGYLRRLFKVLKEHLSFLPEISVDVNDENSGRYSNSDVIKFIRDVFFKDFYDVVKQELKLGTRSLAKTLLFKLLFKKTNKPDALVNQLKQSYPVVMSIIAGFKKPEKSMQAKQDIDNSNQESNFSVFLQCIEAELFIDNILIPLRSNGIPCFSRHDSLVVANGDENVVEIFIKTIFAGFGFKYNYRVEEKFWEVVTDDEMETSDFMQWQIDENTLNSDFEDEEHDRTIKKPNHMNYNDLDENQIDICRRLLEIGHQENYYEHVDIKFLEYLSELPLSIAEKNILYDDINNLRYGMSFLQGNTENLLRKLVWEIERFGVHYLQ